MNLSTLISVACAVPQGAAAVIVLWDRFKPKANSKVRANSAKHTLLLAILLLFGTAGTFIAIIWMNNYAKIITIEKPVPCPVISPSVSGDATTHGANSPANSGNGNSTSYGVPPNASEKH